MLVRPLIWCDEGGEGYSSHTSVTPLGTFVYGVDLDGRHYHTDPGMKSFEFKEHPGKEQARLAAEAAWERMALHEIGRYSFMGHHNDRVTPYREGMTIQDRIDEIVSVSPPGGVHLEMMDDHLAWMRVGLDNFYIQCHRGSLLVTHQWSDGEEDGDG